MSLKVTKITVIDDNGVEIVLDVLEATILAVCAGEKEGESKILSQVTTNAAINMELVKRILAPTQAQAPSVPVPEAVEVVVE